MSAQSTTTGRTDSLISPPSNSVGYLVILAAVVTGILHLVLAPRAMGFNQMMGILFILNGLGFLGGVVLYLTPYWNQTLYLVAAAYSIATIVALFVFQGFSIDAFYMQGSLNPMAVITKVTEAIVAIGAMYLYATDS